MSDLFAWTNLFPHRTGLPATIWVSVHGQIASDPDGAEHGGHREAVFAWIELNREVLAEHWRGEIDGAEMAARAKRLP